MAGPFHFAVQSGLPDDASVSGSGAFDAGRQVYEATMTVTGGKSPGTSMRIAIGKDHFVRQSANERWVHLDMSRVSRSNSLTYFDLSDPTGGGGGVAYFAHIGGFAFGVLLIRVFANERRRRRQEELSRTGRGF